MKYFHSLIAAALISVAFAAPASAAFDDQNAADHQTFTYPVNPAW